MKCLWALVVCAVAYVSAEHSGSSLRGALEALQRRQRGRVLAPLDDYEPYYDVLAPQAYAEPDYGDGANNEDDTPSKYIVKLLDHNESPQEAYEYRIVKKTSHQSESTQPLRKESAFRERSHHDNDKLRDFFMNSNDIEENKNVVQEKGNNDDEYAILLGHLWTIYKNHKDTPQGVVKLYKDKIVKKRTPDNWGPIAFKKKRSSDSTFDRSIVTELEADQKPDSTIEDPNYNVYELADDNNDDLREEYAIAFQPLEDADNSGKDSLDALEKHFPISKRSSDYFINKQKKRSTQSQSKREVSKQFRIKSGTDPKTRNDLLKIFGDSDEGAIKSPVKRSSDHDKKPYEYEHSTTKSLSKNNTQEVKHNNDTNESHEKHSHSRVLKENMKLKNGDDTVNLNKRSIDWSNYFGIDKRNKKLLYDNLSQDRLRKQYFDTFNNEVISPLNSYRQHKYVKRNFIKINPTEQNKKDSSRPTLVQNKEKRNLPNNNDSKLDNIEKKLKNMEGMIIDEALHYSNDGEEVDSKEEQETKEKILSRLAAAYSLEKMRKALKEFKQSIQTQKNERNINPSSPARENFTDKKVVKKEKAGIGNDIPQFKKYKEDEFEEEMGAGHYLNGKGDEHFSEGYMGGSGRRHSPISSTVRTSSSCPVLGQIVQRCHGVDVLAGDRGQLFLPLCSLHQICYLCGAAPPTTCDLVFLAEADTACDGDTGCQRAARSAIMTLRELHDTLSDELDGECEANPCLADILKLNTNWQHTLLR